MRLLWLAFPVLSVLVMPIAAHAQEVPTNAPPSADAGATAPQDPPEPMPAAAPVAPPPSTPARQDDPYYDRAQTTPPEPDVRGFQLGVRLGYGRALDPSSGSSLAHGTPSLLPLALDAGYKTSTHVYFGLSAQMALASRTDCAGASTCSAKEYRFGGAFQYHILPYKDVDPWFGVGLGYEVLHLSGFPNDADGFLTRKGFILLDAQIGADFAIGTGRLRPKIGPYLGLALGTMTGQSGRVYGVDVNRSSNEAGRDHQWVTIGVHGTIDL